MTRLMLILLFLSVACSREPTQWEIDKAASIQLHRKLRCALISSDLNTSGEIQYDSGEYVCSLHVPKRKTLPWISFNEKEMDAIARYIRIKIEIK